MATPTPQPYPAADIALTPSKLYLPPELWIQIFSLSSLAWKVQTSHIYKLITPSIALLLFKGCTSASCCRLPIGLQINHLSRQATIDLLRRTATLGEKEKRARWEGWLQGLPMPGFNGGGWEGRSNVMTRLQGMVVAGFGHEGWRDGGMRSRVFGVAGDGVVHGAIRGGGPGFGSSAGGLRC